MAANVNSRQTRTTNPIVVRHSSTRTTQEFVQLLSAGIVSTFVNGGLIMLMFVLSSPIEGNTAFGAKADPNNSPPQVSTDKQPKKDDTPPPLSLDDVNPNVIVESEPTEMKTPHKRKDVVNVEDIVRGDEDVGRESGIKGAPLMNLPTPAGLGNGQGGATDGFLGTNPLKGDIGGGIPSAFNVPGGPYGRSGATKELLLQRETAGGGTSKTEAAVVMGLDWIIAHQARDGHWSLEAFHLHGKNCNCQGRGTTHNDVAGTAFGLLPLLGAGHTHKSGVVKYSKPIRDGLAFLKMKMQAKKMTGDMGGGMYAQGLATIALCEAYALTRDQELKPYAQRAIDYIVSAQHPEGGWRYGFREKGDTSVVGWQVMALKSAQMAKLKVPADTMKRAQHYLDECCASDEGYGYMGKGSTPTLTAVGLLCRQYIQGWGPNNGRMQKGVDNWIKTNPPGQMRNMYYYYYATQVMHHLGETDWERWNVKMRDILVETQDKGKDPKTAHQKGSWDPSGDAWGQHGGRLMVTSLSILSLEVYYRHLPLFYKPGKNASPK
jgi:hypothetical protein